MELGGDEVILGYGHDSCMVGPETRIAYAIHKMVESRVQMHVGWDGMRVAGVGCKGLVQYAGKRGRDGLIRMTSSQGLSYLVDEREREGK
jgi:hypothetical protein